MSLKTAITGMSLSILLLAGGSGAVAGEKYELKFQHSHTHASNLDFIFTGEGVEFDGYPTKARFILGQNTALFCTGNPKITDHPTFYGYPPPAKNYTCDDGTELIVQFTDYGETITVTLNKNAKNVPEVLGIPYSEKLFVPAKSWGGKVRSGPGTGFDQIASLREGESITILEKTNEKMQDWNWFKIRFRGRVGYQWGGIICPVGSPLPGTFQVCN